MNDGISKNGINNADYKLNEIRDLVDNVEKSNNGENTQYKITTKGIYWLENSIIKK